MIVGRKGIPAADLKELIAWLKAKPDKASAAVPTAGSLVTGILFQKETGTRFQSVPYRGGGPAMQDLVAGQIDMLFVQAAVALPQVRAGAIKAYAATAKSRSAAAPDVPAVDEAGLSGLHISGWFGLYAPKRHAESDHRQAQQGNCAFAATAGRQRTHGASGRRSRRQLARGSAQVPAR